MAATHKATTPSSIRGTSAQRQIARQAARIKSRQSGRRVTWSALVAKVGFDGCQRIVRRAIKESAA